MEAEIKTTLDVPDNLKQYYEAYWELCKHEEQTIKEDGSSTSKLQFFQKLSACNYNEKELIDLIEQVKIDKRFFQEDLLEHIHKELDKKHKLDHKEKLALFVVAATSELPDHEDRKSAAIKGDSSSGKDNIVKTILNHFPEEENKFLTHTTSAALRKSIENVKRIAFSEINAHRENGANKEITETFKQMAEGGINAEICDPITKSPITLKSDQKSLFYGTTDTETDEELETRYVIIPIRSSREKNQAVINNLLDSISNVSLKKSNSKSWIAESIRNLDHELLIEIPYGSYLKGKIQDEDGKEKSLFDLNKPRSMRDSKRLISITKAIAWLHQKQKEEQ